MFPSALESTPGRLIRRFGFRLLLLFLALLALPQVLELAPGLGWLAEWYRQCWQAVVPWVGREVLQLADPVVFRPSGSGDTRFHWVQLWCVSALSVAGALIWVWFDQARKHDDLIHEGVRIAVRYTLGAAMLGYGVAKVLHLQMPPPALDRLIQTYGDSSPMGLAWTFMGLSRGYSLFAGLGEVVGGLMLFFRRTTLAGALLLVAVMLNVVMINLCFDVPVKIYSTQLLVASAFLTLPHWPRLGAVLFGEATVPAAPRLDATLSRGVRIGLVVTKILFVGWLVYSQSAPRWQQMQQQAAPKPELYGLYEVVGFARDGEDRPLLVSESKLWRYVSVNQFNLMIVRQMDGRPRYFRVSQPPAEPGVVELTSTQTRGAPSQKFRFSRPGPNELELAGALDNQEVVVRLRRIDESRFLLLNRGFNWVNEYPFNR